MTGFNHLKVIRIIRVTVVRAARDIRHAGRDINALQRRTVHKNHILDNAIRIAEHAQRIRQRDLSQGSTSGKSRRADPLQLRGRGECHAFERRARAECRHTDVRHGRRDRDTVQRAVRIERAGRDRGQILGQPDAPQILAKLKREFADARDRVRHCDLLHRCAAGEHIVADCRDRTAAERGRNRHIRAAAAVRGNLNAAACVFVCPVAFLHRPGFFGERQRRRGGHQQHAERYTQRSL